MSFVEIVDPGSLVSVAEERNGLGVFSVDRSVVVRVGQAEYCVPSGFKTDGATVPRWARWLFPSWGRVGLPSILHDFLREKTPLQKYEADLIFLMALRACRVPEFRATLMYAAVRIHKGRRHSGVS